MYGEHNFVIKLLLSYGKELSLRLFLNWTHFNNKQLKTSIMYYNQKTGANWLQCMGTFCVKCSRVLTECVTISQKGGKAFI